MRFDILALAFLGVGSLALAAAADPAPATQPERPAASAAVVTDPASPATTAGPAPPPASSPAASPPAAAKAAAPKAAAPELSAYEQHLINLGYKPQVRNGEKVYCRREAALGSRISAAQHCGTVAQLATTTQDGKDYLDNTQRNQLNPVGR
jgi:hypothetical protein